MTVLGYLLLRRVCQHPGNKDAVRDELQPGVHEARGFSGPQDVKRIAAQQKHQDKSNKQLDQLVEILQDHLWLELNGGIFWDVLPEGGECLEVDGLQDVFGGIELQQQHDEYAVVRQLLEICLTDIMVLNQDTDYNTENLEEEIKI